MRSVVGEIVAVVDGPGADVGGATVDDGDGAVVVLAAIVGGGASVGCDCV